MDSLFQFLSDLHAAQTHLIFAGLCLPALFVVCRRAELPLWWPLFVLIPLVGLAIFLTLLAFRPWNGRKFVLKKKETHN